MTTVQGSVTVGCSAVRGHPCLQPPEKEVSEGPASPSGMVPGAH